MESLVECARCHVPMNTWSAPGSPTRYYRCPRCQRTVCSAYDEVIDHGTLAVRREWPAVERRPLASRAGADEALWSEVKGRADAWFARLAADEHAHSPTRRRHRVLAAPALARMIRTRP
jgi:hypothetical protein